MANLVLDTQALHTMWVGMESWDLGRALSKASQVKCHLSLVRINYFRHRSLIPEFPWRKQALSCSTAQCHMKEEVLCSSSM